LREEVRGRQGASFDEDSYRATREVADAIEASSSQLNFLFVSSQRDLEEVARGWQEAGAGPTICCTTAGEIWRGGGHVKSAIAGASLTGVRAEVWPIEDLGTFDEQAAERLKSRMQPFLDGVDPSESVTAIVVLDGLSRAEERVVANLHLALGGIPMVGGSAGDDLAFERTKVLVDGRFREDVGAIALVATAAPTTTFMAHHFERTGQRLVVTAADPDRRRVMELDGLPAAEAYRLAAGFDEAPLSNEQMALAPLVLSIGERTYVRSLAGEADGALDLYCAIEEGVVLQIGRPTDLRERLAAILSEVDAKVGAPQLVLGFDCILRRLEMEHLGLVDAVKETIGARPFFGFSTYGEVFGGLHVNQTLTGLAFGR
jgi:hypothetical protein